MASIISIGIKGKDGKYVNYTISIQDELDRYGNNVSMYVEQSKEERDGKVPRQYVGNGRVVWHNGDIKTFKELENNNFNGFEAPATNTPYNNAIPQQEKTETINSFVSDNSDDEDELPF